MPLLDFVQICSDIATTLTSATGIQRVQDASDESDGITESIPEADLPLIQVYPEEWSSSDDSETQSRSFMGGSRPVSQTRNATFNLDVYVAPRGADIAVSMASYIQVAEDITTALEAEIDAPFFGNNQIQAFTFSASRVHLDYSGMTYVGIRFQLVPKVF